MRCPECDTIWTAVRVDSLGNVLCPSCGASCLSVSGPPSGEARTAVRICVTEKDGIVIVPGVPDMSMFEVYGIIAAAHRALLEQISGSMRVDEDI